jgi:hypothetical protein
LTPPLQPPLEVFFSYSHRDEDLRNELEKHLAVLKRRGIISAWHDRRIAPGTDWASAIDERLESAHVILLLVSADFVNSDYCYGVELHRAMERHATGDARVIPILLRAVEWAGTPFSDLQALPTDAVPITSWENRDEAFSDVARGISRAVVELTGTNPLSRQSPQRPSSERQPAVPRISRDSRRQPGSSAGADTPQRT